MIITITLNPAIDRTLVLNHDIVIGKKNRGVQVTVEPGGSGIHASRAIKALGGSSLALGFVAGSNGRQLKDALTSIDILHDFSDVPGQTRVNLHVFDKDGNRTDFHEPGYNISDGDFLRFLDRVKLYIDKGNIFVIGGNTPRGLSKNNVKTLFRTITKAGCPLVFEAEGEPLLDSLAFEPDCIVCDGAGLADAVDMAVDTPEEALAASQKAMEMGAKSVCVSLGHKGILLASQSVKPVFATIPDAKPFQHTIALLDAMTGALAHAMHQGYTTDDTAKFVYAMGDKSSHIEGTGIATLRSVFNRSQDVKLYEF